MRQDDKKYIQSVTSAWSIYNSDLKSCINSYLQGNIIEHKMNIPYKHINSHTYIHTLIHSHTHRYTQPPYMHACTHTHTHTHSNTHTHTHTYTHTHTHTRIHTEDWNPWKKFISLSFLRKSLMILWYLNSANLKSYKVLYQFCWFSDTLLTGARINNEKWV